MAGKLSLLVFIAVLGCSLATTKLEKQSKFRWIPIGGGSRPSNNQGSECPSIRGCVAFATTPGTTKDGCNAPSPPAGPVVCDVPAPQRVKCYWPAPASGANCRREIGIRDCRCDNP